MMLSGGMGGQMGGQMNPLMLSLLLGDDVPKSKASYDKICASDPACAAEVAKIYNSDGVSIFSQNISRVFYDYTRNTIFIIIFRPRLPPPTLMSRPLMMPSWNTIPAHQAPTSLISFFSQWCPVVVCKEVCKVFSHFSSWRTIHLPVFSVMTTAFSLWWWWVAKTVWLQSWDKYSLRLANVSRDTFVHLRVLTWRHLMMSSVLFCAFNC